MPFSRRTLASVVALAAVAAALPACTTVSRGIGNLTANKYAKPRSGTEWVIAPPQLDPPASDARTIYISHRNLSDLQDLEIKPIVVAAAQSEGWQVVSDPEAATFRLRGQTRFFGEVEPGSGGVAQARALGVVTGAAVGIGTGIGVAEATDSGLAGAAAGGAAGGLVGLGIANASTPREWALIVDWVLEERMSEPTEFDVYTDSSATAASGMATSTTRSSTGGGERARSGSYATNTRTSNYFPHGVRLSAWANQMNMRENEAAPKIRERVERVVANMLPQ
ncbi:MAG: complement resistance protein TraT [Planctomycetota bacterium]